MLTDPALLDPPATLARMGHMKNLDIIIRQGGDDAIAAVSELLRQREDEIERLREQLAQAKATTHRPDIQS